MPAPSVHAVSSDPRFLSAVINKVKAYVALTKPRIVLLMVFSALCSAIVAEGGMAGGLDLGSYVGRFGVVCRGGVRF
jgi:heme O synthase-like polyprenyltransferase